MLTIHKFLLPGDHDKHRDPHRVSIREFTRLSCVLVKWIQVTGSANQARFGQRQYLSVRTLWKYFAETDIGKSSIQVCVEEDVCRLDVPVYNPLPFPGDGFVKEAQSAHGISQRPSAVFPSERCWILNTEFRESTFCGQGEHNPVVQVPTVHEREDEAFALHVKAAAHQWEEMFMMGSCKELCLPLQLICALHGFHPKLLNSNIAKTVCQ
mmetsp:Transcript_23339/g.53032  ORF Transcript_23339/g.53032 Transcript_23339/m.53032 type:complete len:210 (+) Transcript_23339:330-959(+)